MDAATFFVAGVRVTAIECLVSVAAACFAVHDVGRWVKYVLMNDEEDEEDDEDDDEDD